MTPLTIQQSLEMAIQHHQAGQLAEAEQIYRQILVQQPEQPEAMHLMGVIAHQVGQNDQAIQWIGRAIELKPDFAAAHANLGIALAASGKLDEAIEAYRAAIACDPQLAVAYSNLGNVLKNRGRIDEAIAAYREAIALRPDDVEAYTKLGNVLIDTGQFDEAIANLRKTVQLKPDLPEVHNNLGAALGIIGEYEEAIASIRRALVLRPDFASAVGNLRGAQAAKKKREKYVSSYRQDRAVVPDLADATYTFGNAIKDSRGPNLILGTAWGLGVSDVRIFIQSLRKHYQGDVMMLVTSQGSEELVNYLRKNGVIPIYFDCPIWMGIHIQVGRYIRYAETLRSIGKEYEHVFLTDVTDVLFQADPFAELPEGDLLCFLEAAGKPIGQCRSNSLWVRQIYGSEGLDKLRNHDICCSGTTIGTHRAILNYIDLMLEHAKPAIFAKTANFYFGHDQGIHNYLLRTGALPAARLMPNGGHVYTVATVPDEELSTGPGGAICAGETFVPHRSFVQLQTDASETCSDGVSGLGPGIKLVRSWLL